MRSYQIRAEHVCKCERALCCFLEFVLFCECVERLYESLSAASRMIAASDSDIPRTKPDSANGVNCPVYTPLASSCAKLI